MLKPIILDKLNLGLIDGVDEHNTPPGAFIKSEGFEYRRGYPLTVYGRQKKTSSEIRTSKSVRDIKRWVRADGTERYYVLIDGGLFEGTAPTAFATLRSTINLSYEPKDGTADTVTVSVSGTTAVVGGGTPKCLLTVKVGDLFYTTNIANAVAVASVTNDTTFELADSSFNGTSGASFTLWRQVTDSLDSRLLLVDNKVWVFSTSHRPHWYNGTHFRESGLPKPAERLKVALADGTILTAGDYFWSYAYEDADGNVGPVIATGYYTADSSNDIATLTNFKNGPAWAVKVKVYRTIAGGFAAYCITPDVTRRLKTATKDNGTSTLTLNDDAADLVTDMHIDRYVEFVATGNKYLITDNDATTITVTGDASGETGTDTITITGGYDIDEVVAGSVIDSTPDASLDLDQEAPTHQDQAPVGLIYPHVFLGGGRICAYKDATQTEVYFSGRSTEAATATGDATAGLGEFEYWTTSHHVGRQDGDEIKGFVNVGPRTFCLKERSVWELFNESDDVLQYSWFPRAKTIGCLSPRAIVETESVAYWIGHDGHELDVIRFDGNVGYGMFRAIDRRLGGSRLRATLDSMATLKLGECTGTFFQGRLYMSFPTAAVNNKTLRFDFKTFTADIQPWGCGVFAEPYWDSADGFVMLCGDPIVLGNVFDVLGTQQDNGSNISRTLTTGRLHHGGVPSKSKWAELFLRVINEETITTRPTISYSIDTLKFSDGGKTWETTVYPANAWPLTAGEHTVRLRLEVGEYSEDLMLKFTSTDAETWGIKWIEVRGDEKDQHHPLP
jgi:hypothetical protein